MECIQRIGEEVLPKFRKSKAGAAAWGQSQVAPVFEISALRGLKRPEGPRY